MTPPPIHNPVLPFIGTLDTVRPGLLIRIQGKVNPSARCLAINLQCGPSVNPRDDIALHLSPVFTPPPRVVRNSLENGRWGPEESHGPFFPFGANESFEVIILTDHDAFKIAVNGQHFTEFRYRIPIYRITHISIDGDTTISRILFEENPLPSAPPLGRDDAPPYPTGPIGPVPPYPPTGSSSMPPYPPQGGGPAMPPYPPTAGDYPATSSAPYPLGGPGYPTGGGMPMPSASGPPPGPIQPGPYGAPSTSMPYPPAGSYATPYPPPTSGGYPTQPGGYPTQPGGYPQQQGYPGQSGGYPQAPGSYPYPQKSQSGGLLAGLTGAAAALGAGSMLGAGSKYLSGGHKKSSPIPIGGMAAGLGAAALGAAVMGHKPMKKLKKLYKHKFKGPKFFKHKFHKFHGGFKHKGWSSSSSSD